MIKLLIGGSPCTKWSIAQKNGRETEPSGIGWELFVNYLIAKQKFKPDFFLYENNKSAAQAIKDQIQKELGVWDGSLFMEDTGARYIEINSALVSAQNRQRFYVHNCGTVEQPEDRGILLRDILESGVVDREKSYPLLVTHQGNARDYFKKQHAQIALEPIHIPPYGNDDKARPLNSHYSNNCGGFEHRMFSENPNKQQVDMIAEPVGIGYRGRIEDGKWVKRYESNGEPKANAITTAQTDSMVCEPVRIGTIESDVANKDHDSKQYRVYSPDGKATTLCGQGGGVGAKTGLYATPVNVTEDGKAQTIKAQYSFTSISNICCYSSTYGATGIAIPTDGLPSEQFVGNGKDPQAMKRIYKVKDGFITIKGKKYPIKLADGYYIIRKLTVTECCRLQTLPDDYCRAVSNSQAYKGLGNGWTAEVIIHILSGALKDVPRDEEIVVLSMYDGIGTGRYCLDKMGFTNVKYYAYEIDKYAKQVAMSNYPDIIQCGDAFDLRHPDWALSRF